MDCRVGKASAPNRLPKAQRLGDCSRLGGRRWSGNGLGYGLQALAPLASLSGFTGVPIGSGGLGVSTAALGTAAPVLPTTTLAVTLPRRCAGKSIKAALSQPCRSSAPTLALRAVSARRLQTGAPQRRRLVKRSASPRAARLPSEQVQDR